MSDKPDLFFGEGDIVLTELEVRQFEAIMAGGTFAEMTVDELLFPRETFFIGFRWDGDMGNVDIAGWNFSGANLSGADMSQVQNITQAVFDKKTKFEGTKLPEGITADILL